jgi:hypothetical protein
MAFIRKAAGKFAGFAARMNKNILALGLTAVRQNFLTGIAKLFGDSAALLKRS